MKNINLEWNVLYYDIESKKINSYNILNSTFVETLYDNVKTRKIKDETQLKEYLKTEFMYHYWCKSEFEILIGNLHAHNLKEFEKIDIWYQIEINFDNIVNYIIKEMQLFKTNGRVK